ncbi:hypothetical protein QYE76_058248 [Lolium multiflorum]|uniref:Gnk2-homologous domain-containing protein n=1 Tax=Lolium multiflorum TaxID=4521 RepID=A0AAD8WPI9_LOLMU|nr:hypothetical protein QYE76_058248 [Lolium multiflorum]
MAMVIFTLLLLRLLPFVAAQWPVCGNSGNYTSNSTYLSNLGLLSATLPKKAVSEATQLFTTDAVGHAPDAVFALTLCNGNTTAEVCEGCLVTAFQDGLQLCAYNKDATLYYDECMLRYSNQNFLATATAGDQKWAMLSNSQNFPTSTYSFRLLLFTLLNSTGQSAANSSTRFMTSRLDVSSFPTLYCLMECTPDLTTEDCIACFQVVSQLTFQYLAGSRGARVLGTWCNMRYEIYPFFREEPMLRIINLAPEVPAINNTTAESTPVAMFGSLLVPPPPDPMVQTTVEQHGM